MLKFNTEQRVHNLIWLILALFTGCFFVWNIPYVFELVTSKNCLRAYIFLYILACLLLMKLYLTFYRRLDGKTLGLFIFLGALFIRLAALAFRAYVPNDDFSLYYNLGIHFYEGNYEQIKEITLIYRDSKFAGIALFYGLLARIFSPTLLGFQLANCVITALICLMIYILGATASKKAALAAAFLYMVYPASILSTQMTANHHGATLFLLVSFYTFYKSILYAADKNSRSAALWGLAAGCALVCSDLVHPSALLGLCAMAAFAVVKTVEGMISEKNRRKATRLFSPLLALLIVASVYAILLNISLDVMQSKGMEDRDQDMTLLSKIRVGMDIEHNGMWWDRGYNAIIEIEDQSEQREFCIQEIKRNLSDVKGTLRLMKNKTRFVWFQMDNIFYFYPIGQDLELDAVLEKAQDPAVKDMLTQERMKLDVFVMLMGVLDTVFVNFIWFLVLIGLVVLVQMDRLEVFHLMLWLPAGWMAFILISEAQSRYRYPAMPALMLLAGLGAAALWDSKKKTKQGEAG